MNRIKFIYETRSNRIFMSILSAFILILAAIGLVLDNDSSSFLFGAASGGALCFFILFTGLFLNKNFVYVGNSYLLIRVHRFLFKTILLDRVKSVDISGQTFYIHLKQKSIDIETQDIHEQDVNHLKLLLSKLKSTL